MAEAVKSSYAKIGIVVEEADETMHWLDMLMESEMLPRKRVEPLHAESEELVRIFASTQRTARTNVRKQKSVEEKKITKSPEHKITK